MYVARSLALSRSLALALSLALLAHAASAQQGGTREPATAPVEPAGDGTPAARPAAAPAVATSQAQDPAGQARLQRQDEEMGRAALQVARLVDEARSAEVWDGASRVARETVAREAFVRQVSDDRRRLGPVQSREQVAVTRATYGAGGQVPEGTYISVVFSARFESVAEPVRELVSFRLDEDRSWRVAGYSLR